jgi:uncharacterized protein (TIGR02453 family)
MQISPLVFDFLTKIEQNNHREWFIQNRNMYESALENVENFVTALIERISIFDVSVRNQDVKKCMFRIYRDTRFSPDKSPYKTHFGAYIALGGRQGNNAVYYLHIQDNMSLLAGGLWSPEKSLLKKIREEIYYSPEELVQVIENKDFKSAFGGLIEQDSLKMQPRNYPADFQYIHLLKYRHYCVEKSFSNSEVLASDFLAKCTKTFKLVSPFVTCLNELIKIKD